MLSFTTDFITVNENATDPPMDTEKDKDKEKEKEKERDSLNSASALSLEATYVNQNFGFQVVREDAPPLDFSKPNPFHGNEEVDPLASCGYRYRLFDVSINDSEDLKVAVRTEVDAYQPSTGKGEDGYMTIRTLNEFDSRAQGAGGAPDWRTKLDSQRGAVVATEMKNNSCKLARWVVQSILAGAESMKIGYVEIQTNQILSHFSVVTSLERIPATMRDTSSSALRLCGQLISLAS
jgi:translation initiation factor 3 subunit D